MRTLRASATCHSPRCNLPEGACELRGTFLVRLRLKQSTRFRRIVLSRLVCVSAQSRRRRRRAPRGRASPAARAWQAPAQARSWAEARETPVPPTRACSPSAKVSVRSPRGRHCMRSLAASPIL
eukprot:995802-Pleurochrysis_carterae.AAC.5